MQSSLTKGLSFTLVFSTHLPVSVCGTVTLLLLRGFSRQLRLTRLDSSVDSSRFHLSVSPEAFLPSVIDLPASTCRSTLGLPSCVTPSVQSLKSGTGISTSCPSPSAFTYGLGPTNPKRINLASETLDLRCASFSLAIRYSYRHSHLWSLPHSRFRVVLRSHNAPLPLLPKKQARASVSGFSPVELSAPVHI